MLIDMLLMRADLRVFQARRLQNRSCQFFFRGASLLDDSCKVKKSFLGCFSIFDFFFDFRVFIKQEPQQEKQETSR